MQSFDQSLLQLVMDQAVTVEEAMMHASSKQNFALLLEANNVRIDRDLRRAASGSQGAAQDDLAFDAARRAVPVPVPTAPVAPTYDPAALAPATTEYLPAIGGQPANAHLNFPGAPAAHPAHPAEAQHPAHPAQAQPAQGQVTQGPGGPQQPRPQPGIVPDLPGHNAA